jgi:putative salt-induced outer membrane protein YdiY
LPIPPRARSSRPLPKHPCLTATAIAALVGLAARAPAVAQDEREPGWYDQAEVSFVSTGGNAEASTLALENSLERVWQGAQLGFYAGALRAESTVVARFAVGTPGDFDVVEDERTDLTAENYFARFRYDRKLREDMLWFGGLGWERNEFAGFSDRVTAVGGVGNVWWQRDDGHFRTDYGVTWTQQDDLVENPSIADSFLGLQVSWDYLRKFGARASYQNLLLIHENLDETEDLRADMTHSVQASMTERLALKVSLQLRYDNLPALIAVPLFDSGGEPTGNLVLAELDELDTLFTVALVVSF